MDIHVQNVVELLNVTVVVVIVLVQLNLNVVLVIVAAVEIAEAALVQATMV